MKIALFGNTYQDRYLAELRRFVGFLAESREFEIVVENEFGDYLRSMGMGIERAACFDADAFAGADLAVSVGGDGTLLGKAATLAQTGTPVLGVNSGHLGYLTACPLSQAPAMIAAIRKGEYLREERAMLQVVEINGESQANMLALNEIAVLRQDTTSMIAVHTRIGGTVLTTYKGDGLVISTPTGSTAYNMSVGGPIINPSTSCLALSPISPHSLTMRPIVISDTSVIEIEVSTRAHTIQLSRDGHALTLPGNCRVKIAKAPQSLTVIQPQDHNFADTLRKKLLWGADQR